MMIASICSGAKETVHGSAHFLWETWQFENAIKRLVAILDLSTAS